MKVEINKVRDAIHVTVDRPEIKKCETLRMSEKEWDIFKKAISSQDQDKRKYIVRSIHTAMMIQGTFEANSEKEAIEKADENFELPMLCNHCSELIEINEDPDRFEAEEI